MPRRSQEDRSRSTRAALEAAGLRLFAARGYSGVSAEEIVAEAGVTRGALHHHYGDKKGLFTAVLEKMEVDNTAEINETIAALPDPDDLRAAIAVGLHRFLEINQRPEVRIAMIDALSVIGWQAWRDMEARHGLGMITDQLQSAVDAGFVVPVPVRIMAHLLLSAITEAGMLVAHAEDPERTAAEAEQSILQLVSGIIRQPESD